MARGMLRGAAAAWLGLVTLQAATSKGGSGAVSGLLSTVNGLVSRALDPAVPAIADHSHGSGLPAKTPVLGSDGKPNGSWLDDKGRLIPPSDSTQQQPNAPQTHSEAYIPWPATPGTTTA